jgi:Ca2+-binding EF-hand superfamily protein
VLLNASSIIHLLRRNRLPLVKDQAGFPSMTASTPSTVSRYRPAVLFLAGVSAAYATYLIYNTVQSPGAGDGLQRSNAVRRRRPREQPSPPSLPLNERDIPFLGLYELLGSQVPLDPSNLGTPSELRGIILSAQPDANDETIENLSQSFYNEFLDRLLVVLYPDRAISPSQVDSIRTWLNQRNPDNAGLDHAAVARAAARHAQIFPPGESPALDDAESVAGTDLSLGSDDDADDAIDPEGQTLQRTLYHIAEDRARLEGVIHRGITCNGCDEKPIRGTRWHCANCPDFDLCSNCEATNSHYKNHIFYKIRVPAPYLSLQKQEPLYPGKPHMMSPSIDPALKRRLVAETKMEAEEIEALWDQFTCLAGAEWASDTTGVGWAIDRRDFNHAFIPRYNDFVAAPNLVYDRIFAYYDTDKNGLIGFEEWVKGLDGMHDSDVDVKARIVFNGYDIDGDGYISRKDVLRIFRAYYAIEKEATRNYISELSDEVTVRTALDTIRSSQPLGSAFPPRSMAASNTSNSRLRQKRDEDAVTTPPLLEHNSDVADRAEIIGTTGIHHVAPTYAPQTPEEQQASIVTRRWARRQYYIDEEEGLARPEGFEGSDPDEPGAINEANETAEAAGTNGHWARNRSSRSSSRVRFQDDVEMETRSNASSSRPVGERWGGYEIPEPEQDLGKEVLYQVTQQGFNELLNPLFLEKEDMAMDAHEMRSERRANAAAIDNLTLHHFTEGKAAVEAIVQVGVFRFSKCMIDRVCRALNHGHSDVKTLFQNRTDGKPFAPEEACAVVEELYDTVEAKVLKSVKVSRNTNVDNMTMWNMLLIRSRLRSEILNAIMECAQNKGWWAQPAVNGSLAGTYRDPTMPQFRPNSSNLPSAATLQTSSNSSSNTSVVSDDDTSSLSSDEGTLHRCFFVVAGHDGLERDPGRRYVGEIDSLAPDGMESSEEAARHESSATQQEREEDLYAINWRWYTDNPEFHYLFTHNAEGVNTFLCARNPISHSASPHYPENNQLKPLQRSIRQLAMNPMSGLHLIMLASLEAVEQEINERKGSGLINFEEFLEHMRQGRLKFLEAWMEWVSM